jgi:putative lipoprotein (rSAM/lipoprotein system)
MMEMMSRALIKGTNWMLAVILSMLGFSGCDLGNEDVVGPVEYGTPYAKFSFNGTVTNKDGNPVKDIKVEIDRQGVIYLTEPMSTDTLGRYSTMFADFPVEDFKVIVSDVDGEENGSYQSDTIAVKITKDDYYEQGHGAWYHGSATKKVDVELEDKE